MEMNQSETSIAVQLSLPVLRQQVKIQSKECDFAVSMGKWSKRFHSRVLVRAEFFNCLLNSQFQEKEKECVEIAVGGCPENLEAAIMFLYGKRRLRITWRKIGHLLDLAEFLDIPDLKTHLIEVLRRQTVIDDNKSMFLLLLASVYNFEPPNCDKYILANLTTCLERQELLYLTRESVMSLLSNDTLIYVGSDCKLKFVLKWLRQREPAWAFVGKEMLELIDMDEVSADLMTEVQTDPMFQRCNAHVIRRSSPCHNRTVLLMKAGRVNNVFWAYDIERSLWFRVKSETAKRIRFLHRKRDHSTLNSLIYIQYIESVSNRDHITVYDIGMDASKDTTIEFDKIVAIQENDQNVSYRSFCYNNGMVWFLMERKEEEVRCSHRLFPDHIGYVNTLYSGVVNTEGGITKVNPILEFPFEPHFDYDIQINESNCIAWFSRDEMHMYIFDATLYALDVLYVAFSTPDKLRPTASGFVIYNESRVIDISRQERPSLSSRYVINKIRLMNYNEQTGIKYWYAFTENMWIRHGSDERGDTIIVEWVSHDVFKQNTSIQELPWIPITPIHTRSSYRFMEDSIKVSMPRSKLTCHVGCPHCYRQMTETLAARARDAGRSQTLPYYVPLWLEDNSASDGDDIIEM